MMKNYLNILLTFALPLLLSAFIAPTNWISIQKDGYRISFPGNPISDSSNVNSKSGTGIMQNFTFQNSENTVDSNIMYRLSIMTYSAELPSSTDKALIKKLFDGTVKGAINAEPSAKLLSEKEISLDKYLGREVKLSVADGQGIVVIKITLVGQKMYALYTVADAGKEKNGNATRFYNSFRVK